MLIKKIKLFLSFNRKECILISFIFLFLIFIGIFSFYMYSKEDEVRLIEDDEIALVNYEDTTLLDNTLKTVRVDIKGQIVNPGVYEVESDKRVIDVINYAGGLLDGADTSVNNLSRLVKDEMVIIIYSSDEVKNFSKTKEDEQIKLNNINNSSVKNDSVITNNDLIEVHENSTNEDNQVDDNANQSTIVDSKVSINTASLEELTTLNGIGKSKAQAIIDYRNTNGLFKSIEDILNVSGIGEKLFAKIKDSITL